MKEKNYWPHFIIALVVFAVMMGVWTVKTAIDNPVELDNSYMMKYQDVDNNYYKIEKDAREFDKRYVAQLLNKKLHKGQNRIELVLKDKSGKIVPNATVEFLLTRPDTSRYDQKVQAHFKDGKYIATVDLPLEGRWNVVAKISVGDITRYLTRKLSTRRVIENKLKNS